VGPARPGDDGFVFEQSAVATAYELSNEAFHESARAGLLVATTYPDVDSSLPQADAVHVIAPIDPHRAELHDFILL
jgi:hypothetical protein